MKLVITRDLANVAKLSLTPDKEQVHKFNIESPIGANKLPKHLHKGTRVTIGTSEKADELSPEEQEKILWLHNSKAIVPVADKSVERIDREVKLEIEKEAKQSVKQPNMAEMIAAAVATALAEAGLVKGAKA